MKRVLAFGAAMLALVVACESSDLVIGDDTQPNEAEDGGNPMTSGGPDSSKEPTDGSTSDVTIDATLDAEPDVPCPALSPPGPGFCDGGPIAAKYDPSSGCMVGFGCAPITCTEGGGQCVGLTPTACPAPKKIGEATKYSCGGGLGSACCLP